jgi:hypothetical protein
MPECRKCGVELTAENWFPSLKKSSQHICKGCATATSVEWYKTHLKNLSERRENNRKRYNAYFRGYNQTQKLKVIKHYTNGTMRCPNCGCSEIKCLTVEHLNGNGMKHRKITGFGLNFYRWIIRNNFPDDLTVLCMNCNWIKREQKKNKDFLECIRHYSNRSKFSHIYTCAMCGIKDLRVLSIDHINGDGARQRKELGNGGGRSLARWLKKRGYPEGYQILCMNCQFKKKFMH